MPQVYVVDNDKASALSIGGGDNWTIVSDDEDLADATSGDLIVYGQLVGFALTDYDATREEITITVVGGYEVEVVAEDASGSEDVWPGTWLYWDAAASEVNVDATNGVPIGQALEAIDGGDTATIGIVLRPVPPAYA